MPFIYKLLYSLASFCHYPFKLYIAHTDYDNWSTVNTTELLKQLSFIFLLYFSIKNKHNIAGVYSWDVF